MLGMFNEHLKKYCLYSIRAEVMHGLLGQRWLDTARHSAVVWGRFAEQSPHRATMRLSLRGRLRPKAKHRSLYRKMP